MANVNRHVVSQMLLDMADDPDIQNPGPADDLTNDPEGAPTRARRRQFELANQRIADWNAIEAALDNDPDVDDSDEDELFEPQVMNVPAAPIAAQPLPPPPDPDPDPDPDPNLQPIQQPVPLPMVNGQLFEHPPPPVNAGEIHENLSWPMGTTAPNVVWDEQYEQNRRQRNFTPERPSGPSEEVRGLPRNPLAFFELLYSELHQRLRQFTNLKGQRYYGHLPNRHAWKDMSVAEADIFLGLLLGMALNKKGSVREYWARSDCLYERNMYREHLSGERFRQMLYAMTIVDEHHERRPGGTGDPNSPNFERLWKINDYARNLIPKFQKLLYPEAFLCIDERIKVFVLCDAETKYMLNFIIYCGEGYERFEECGAIFSYVWTLLTGSNAPQTHSFIGRNFSAVADSYYSTSLCTTGLHLVDTHYIGTINQKRGIPEEAVNPQINGENLKIGQSKTWVDSNGQMTLTVWKDRKVARIMSSMPDVTLEKTAVVRNVDHVFQGRKYWEEEVIDQPEIFAIYNKNKSAVDCFNQTVSNCHAHLKSFQWTRPIHVWMAEICKINALILYRLVVQPKCTAREFRTQLVAALLRRGRENENPVMYRIYQNQGDLNLDFVPPWCRKRGNQPLEQVKPKLPRKKNTIMLECLRLSKKVAHLPGYCDKESICAVHCRRKRSTHCCRVCKVALCLEPCWDRWHTMPNNSYLLDDRSQADTVLLVRKPPV